MTGRSLLDTGALVAAVLADPDALAALGAGLTPYLVQREELLTSQEAAEVLRCSPQRLRRLVFEERLSPLRDGRRLLFSRAELDRYLRGEAR